MKGETEKLLAADHAELDGLLGDVFSALEKDAELVYPFLDLFWARLAVHIRAEHLHLFPALLQNASDQTGRLIASLRSDHNYFMRELGALVRAMRTDSQASARDVLGQLNHLRDRLLEHNRLEEKAIYPLADSGPHDLDAAVKRELNTLPPRFSHPGPKTEPGKS